MRYLILKIHNIIHIESKIFLKLRKLCIKQGKACTSHNNVKYQNTFKKDNYHSYIKIKIYRYIYILQLFNYLSLHMELKISLKYSITSVI